MAETVVTSTKEIGELLRAARKQGGLTQVDFAMLAHAGNRLIVDAENGKPTLQAQRLLDLLSLAGLEVVVRNKKTSA